jgi:hypothetical protein
MIEGQSTLAERRCLNAVSRTTASGKTLTAHILLGDQHYVVSGRLSGGRLRAKAMSNYAASEHMYNLVGGDPVEEAGLPDFWKRVEAAVAAEGNAQP